MNSLGKCCWFLPDKNGLNFSLAIPSYKGLLVTIIWVQLSYYLVPLAISCESL